MAKIIKIKNEGITGYPITIPDAVINPESGENLTSRLSLLDSVASNTLSIRNQFENPLFKQVGESWTSYNATIVKNGNSVDIKGPLFIGIFQNISAKKGDVIYGSFEYSTPPTYQEVSVVRMIASIGVITPSMFLSNPSLRPVPPPEPGTNTRVTGTFKVAEDTLRLGLYASPDDNPDRKFTISSALCFNVTAMFGKGKEPSETEIDEMLGGANFEIFEGFFPGFANSYIQKKTDKGDKAFKDLEVFKNPIISLDGIAPKQLVADTIEGVIKYRSDANRVTYAIPIEGGHIYQIKVKNVGSFFRTAYIKEELEVGTIVYDYDATGLKNREISAPLDAKYLTVSVLAEDSLTLILNLEIVLKDDNITRKIVEIVESMDIKTNSNEIEYSNIIASVDSMLVKKEGHTIYLSFNLGVTWARQLDISELDVIQLCYVFQDGAILLADDRKAYFSKNWDILRESTILDEEGAPLVSTINNTFSMWKGNQNRQIVNGIEIFMWGNYTFTNNQRLWYTIDQGETVKCCFNFSETLIEGELMPITHIHNVDFYPLEESFWVQTGDFGDLSKLIKAIYSTLEDSWTFELIGQGVPFKFTNIDFIDQTAFISWDVYPGGVKKCLVSDIGDISKHELVMSTTKDCIYVIANGSQELLAFITNYGGSGQPRFLFYSNDGGYTVAKIEVPIPKTLDTANAYIIPMWHPNSEGKILGRIRNYDVPSNSGNEPSVWVDDIIRAAGFPDAFKNII